MTTGRKLAIAGLIVAGVTGYMAYLGASSSWRYYVTVDECLSDAARLAKDRIRVNGKIAAGTLAIAEDRGRARFALEGTSGKLAVTCPGPLPDNLAERMDVVVEGRLDDRGTLCGEKVLTRCASKYQSQDNAAGAESPTSGSKEGA
ncbi:MAG: cytochrome c maturation protein CcmE [Pirellulales bacterium]